MAARLNSLLRHIHGMVVPPGKDETCDAVLVNRFIAHRDGRAFSALINRHGELVLHVCRRILSNSDDAEDAFQATFLVLARKAHSIRSRESLASWLHGVARRVSLKARALRARRMRLETAAQHPPVPSPDPMEVISCRELLGILDEELERLPEKQRLPIILCCLEGLSLEEAAVRLGWKPGAVKGRLQRGRHRLHERLVRRGLTLSAVLAAVEASRSPASSAVVSRLATAADRGGFVLAPGQVMSAGGISVGATTLARAVLRAMALTRLAIAAVFLLPICLVAVGFAVLGTEQPPSAERFRPDSERSLAATALVRDKRAEAVDEDDVPIEVNGRVLDPAGKPYAGASLYVGYAVTGGRIDLTSQPNVLPVRAKSGADGRFQFTFSRTELDARMLDDSKPAVIAVASGFGPEWSQIAGPGQAETLTLKLVEDFPVNGRLLDSKGKPVAGAKIRVLNVDTDSEENVTLAFARRDTSDDHRRRWRGAFPERPREVTTGIDGRFRLTGLGRDRIAMLDQDEPVHLYGFFFAIARPTETAPNALNHGANFDVVAPDTRLVRGVCRDQATGKPVAGVRMSVCDSTSSPRFTDVNGRFEMPVASEVCVVAEPATGQPYFAASAPAPQTTGPEPITMNFDLVRGIPVAGKVLSPPGTKPPRAGRVEYYPLSTNIHAAKIQAAVYRSASSGVIQPDGCYRLVVLPGPGAVVVDASPKKAFAAAMVDDQELSRFFQDGKRHQDDRGEWHFPKA
jgi:RNA polymerase sigma factor (sigma-70 family)